MARNVIEIANKIVSLSNIEVGDLISNLKLQKLLYYVQGFNLAKHNEPLFNEDICAWIYGPVIPEAYHHFKKYGSGHIEIDNEDYQKYYVDFSDIETKLIFDIWNVYGQYSAYRLMRFTHDEPPYKSTPINNIITHDLLKDFFITQLDEIN